MFLKREQPMMRTPLCKPWSIQTGKRYQQPLRQTIYDGSTNSDEVFLMSEVHQEALLSPQGQPALANSPEATRSGRTATKLDCLLLLAAVLAYTFGGGPLLGTDAVGFVPSSLLSIVAVSLLWLGGEQVVARNDRWVVSPGWLRTLTQGDVLILLLALLNSLLLHLPLLVAVLIWGVAAGLARLRGQRASADDWFHRAALFASFAALMIGDEAAKVWLFSGAVGDAPSPLTHAGFHQVLDGATGISCTFLWLLLAWTGLRRGHGWAVVVWGVSAFPAAALAAWAASVALLNQRDYGYLHPYAWLLPIFWGLTMLSAMRGLALQPRAPSTVDA